MFDQLKDLNNLRKQAQEIERQLSAQTVEGVSNDQLVKLSINGKHEVLDVHIAENVALEKENVEKAIKQAFEDAQNKLQRLLQDRFKGII